MKKIIIPIALGVSLLSIIIYFAISGPSNKVTIDFTPRNVAQHKTDSIELKVYVENSGSMNAYMCPGSTLKDAVFSYISDIKKEVYKTELYYINSKIIPYNGSLDSFIKDLTPQSFAKAGGNTANTDLREMFKMMLAKHKQNTITIFISDCILDIPQNAQHFFGNCQISMKNSFNDAIRKNKNLGVEIAKMESTFDGFWYCGSNSEKLFGVKRPYYIWVIGDNSILANINKIKPLYNNEFGFKDYCAFSTANDISFDIETKKYVVGHSGQINIEILADLGRSLQSEKILTSVGQYTLNNAAQVNVTSIEKITIPNSSYSHVINLQISNPKTLHDESLNFNYPGLPACVESSNDDSGKDIKKNIDKTTGLKYLINGVAQAYESYKQCGNITFKYKNK